jgi:arylformamidase
MNGPTAAIAKPKGPIVWLDMDQRQLDDAYDQLVYAPNRDQLAKRRIANSAAARARLGEPLRLAYGPTPIETLDFYRPLENNAAACAPAPVAIFVHGGAWRTGAASEFTFLAEPFVRASANFAVLDFITVDDAGGSLFPMVEQVRRAVGWVYRRRKLRQRPQPALSDFAFLRIASCRLRGDARLDARGIAARHP